MADQVSDQFRSDVFQKSPIAAMQQELKTTQVHEQGNKVQYFLTSEASNPLAYNQTWGTLGILNSLANDLYLYLNLPAKLVVNSALLTLYAGKAQIYHAGSPFSQSFPYNLKALISDDGAGSIYFTEGLIHDTVSGINASSQNFLPSESTDFTKILSGPNMTLGTALFQPVPLNNLDDYCQGDITSLLVPGRPQKIQVTSTGGSGDGYGIGFVTLDIEGYTHNR